jgi:hypothetical protein
MSRQRIVAPPDLWVESPDRLGGFVRHHETPAMILCAVPIYMKLGLRNSPDIHPCGLPLETPAVVLGRERVRRSKLVRDLVRREHPEAKMPPGGGPGPALSVPEL